MTLIYLLEVLRRLVLPKNKLSLWNKILLLSQIMILAIKFSYLRRVKSFKGLISSNTKQVYLNRISAQTLVRYSNFILNFFNVRSCFTRSLVIQDLLKKWGYNPEIQIGIKNENDCFESHCWIKLDNLYNEEKSTRNRFKIIDSIK